MQRGNSGSLDFSHLRPVSSPSAKQVSSINPKAPAGQQRPLKAESSARGGLAGVPSFDVLGQRSGAVDALDKAIQAASVRGLNNYDKLIAQYP